jgi:hypothetical protein
MRFRRRVDDPTARLWRELEDWFQDEDGYHPGEDLLFAGLTGDELERGWAFLAEKADRLNPSSTVWDHEADCEVSVVEMLAQGAVAAAARSPELLVGLHNIRASDSLLPYIGVWLYSDALALFWWVGADWKPDSAASLATLLHQLRDELLPTATITLESGWEARFWNAIDSYIATTKAGSDASANSRDRR